MDKPADQKPVEDKLMISLVVSYPRSEDGHFDADYYVSHHLPLVREAWGPHGLDSIEGYFPAGDEGDILAMAVCTFANQSAIDTAFAAPRTDEVMADVANYTNLTPLRSRLEQL